MTTTTRAAGVLAAVAFLALGVVTLTGPAVPDEHWGTRGSVVNLLGLLGFAATAVAAERLSWLLDLGRVGAVALRVAQVGLLAMTVESVASQIHGGTTIGGVFALGLLAALLGFLVVGAVGLRSGRWVAPLPFLGLLVGVAGGEHGGFAVLGLVWLVLALAPPTPAGTSPEGRTEAAVSVRD